MKHKHYECIVAWAEGKEIQVRSGKNDWEDLTTKYPDWFQNYEYRIKPQPKPDVVDYLFISDKKSSDLPEINWVFVNTANLKLIWDGETGKLKSAEVIK